LLKRGDCKELLLAADRARADRDKRLARDLAAACPQAGLLALVDAAKVAAEKMLWCGRARAALDRGETPTCPADLVVSFLPDLKPKLTIGPADAEAEEDKALEEALDEIGSELNLRYDHEDPVVYAGTVKVTMDRTTSQTLTAVADAGGKRHQIAATLHRVLARAELQVDLGAKTRTLHATEEARDLTWNAEERLAIAARFEPQIAPEAELRKRAVISLVRNLARALASSPPEGVDATDAPSCMAYGLALAVATGDRTAAAHGVGEAEKLAACEKILGMPEGAGIPIP
jgi:hypothetical protein